MNIDIQLEKSELRLGFVPLVDAAPLAIAEEKGFFARHGLHVELVLERSWASIRDKVAVGLLDGAHMPAPMPIAAALGLDGMNTPMLTALSLNLNGNAITLSCALHERIAKHLSGAAHAKAYAQALKIIVEEDRLAGRSPLVFAHVFPYSKHHYELRLWLEAGDIDPDQDVQLAVIPPPQMATRLKEGVIDGFCVGAPWSEVARRRGTGRTVATSFELWNNSPEKVLGVTREWAERHPQTHIAMVAALIGSARWLDQPDHRKEAARILVDGGYVAVPGEVVEAALHLDPSADALLQGGLVFHRGAAGFPWQSHARWFIGQMRRCRQLDRAVDEDAAALAAYRPEIYRAAAQLVNEPCPESNQRPEDLHDSLWQMPVGDAFVQMGPDRFLSGIPAG